MHEQGERITKSGGEGGTVKSEDKPAAIACSLDTADYQQRLQRFANLNREFLLESHPVESGLELIYSLEAAAEVRDLVRLEQECCPFLRLRLEQGESSLKLSIALPESARPSVDALLAPFVAQ
jgi:hypothetical protein